MVSPPLGKCLHRQNRKTHIGCEFLNTQVAFRDIMGAQLKATLKALNMIECCDERGFPGGPQLGAKIRECLGQLYV